MPQGPFQTVNLSVANKSALNLTANTLVKSSGGFIVRVSVVATSSTAGSIHDAASVAAAASANEVAVIPATVGTYAIEFPAASGIAVKPGAGQTIAISYN